MSSYQIFRIALLNLSEADWHTKGISVKDSLKVETVDAKQLSLSEFHKSYQVVFIDSTGYLNVTSKMSAQTFLRVKHEAQLGMSLLNNELAADNFNQLFIKNQTSQLVFDALLR
jgi:U3 small nucleolar RNA-associated protein 22